MRRWSFVACCAARIALGGGCDTLGEQDNVYSRGAEPSVFCAMNIDDKNQVGEDAIAEALDRARLDGTILHVYAHRPGVTIDTSTLDALLAGAAARGLAFVTYRDLLAGATGPGLALGFDDHDLVGWTATAPLFARYGAHVTLFVSAYHALDDGQRGMLRDLATAGHDVEYHSTHHEDARAYALHHGVAAYVEDDIAPDLALMRADGYDPQVFAYPFGAHTTALDAALLELFPRVRASQFRCPL